MKWKIVACMAFCAVILAGCGNTNNSTSSSMVDSASVQQEIEKSTPVSEVSTDAMFDEKQSQELMEQAESYFEQREYRKSADAAQKAYELTQNEESYNFLIKGIIEKLAENCEFDNPQALRTQNMYGDMEWYLSCDGINGKPLDKLSDESIIEKFKDFRQSYHDVFDPYGSLTFSFGHTTIGDFYCNEKWYDVHVDDMFGKDNYVTIYTPEEQNEKVASNIDASEELKNMPHTPSGWTTGGPETSLSNENLQGDSNSIPQEYKNALTTAREYYYKMALSKQRVREQLRFEGFPDEAIDYAINNLD